MEIRTLIVITFLMFALSMLVLASVWVQYRSRYKGLLFWWLQAGFSMIGTSSIILRPWMTLNVSIMIANIFLHLGIIFLLFGFQQFFGRAKLSHVNWAGFVLTGILISFLTFQYPSVQGRQIVLSAAIIFAICQILWLLYRQDTVKPRKSTISISLILLAMLLAHGLRIILTVLDRRTIPSYYDNPLSESAFLLAHLIVWVLLTYALVLLVTRRLQTEIEAEERKFNSIFTHSPYASALTRLPDALITDVNRSFSQLTGYSRDFVVGKRAHDFGLWADPNLRDQLVADLAEDHPIENYELMMRRQNGELLNCLFSATIIRINGQSYMLSTLKDVSDVVELRAKLEKLATHDPLTHLPNRTLFDDRFAIARAQALRSDSKFVVALFDIDDFKAVNDTYGHPVGDQVLKAVAELASHYLRLSDTVARFGGDEFVLLLNNIPNRAAARETLERILELYQQPLRIPGYSITTQISLGAACFPEDGDNLPDLIRKADDALYQVKKSGKNAVQFYQERKSNHAN